MNCTIWGFDCIKTEIYLLVLVMDWFLLIVVCYCWAVWMCRLLNIKWASTSIACACAWGALLQLFLELERDIVSCSISEHFYSAIMSYVHGEPLQSCTTWFLEVKDMQKYSAGVQNLVSCILKVAQCVPFNTRHFLIHTQEKTSIRYPSSYLFCLLAPISSTHGAKARNSPQGVPTIYCHNRSLAIQSLQLT